MRECKGENGVVFYRFEALEGFVHALSGRSGGVSAGPYSSLNLGFGVGDEPEAVVENRRRFARAAGFEVESLVAARQVLGNVVAWVEECHRGRGALDATTALPETDALITETPGLVLMTFSADCPLVALADPVRGAVGLAHASRRGTFGRVVERTVRAMEAFLGCVPRRMVAVVGPSICPDCYEVGEEIVEECRAGWSEGMRFFSRRGGRLVFDLRSANVAQLVGCGLRRGRVEVVERCTRCEPRLFFSHRGSGGKTGRFCFVLGVPASRGAFSLLQRFTIP